MENWTELDRSVQLSWVFRCALNRRWAAQVLDSQDPAMAIAKPATAITSRRRFSSNDRHCIDWPIHKCVLIVKSLRRPPIQCTAGNWTQLLVSHCALGFKAKTKTSTLKAGPSRPRSKPRPQVLRPSMQVRLTKRIGNELNFTCFCLDIHLLIITYKLLSTYYYTYIYFTTKVDNKTKYSKSEKHCFNLLPCMSFRVMPKTVNAALKTRPQKLNATSTQYRSLRDIFTANHETGAKKNGFS